MTAAGVLIHKPGRAVKALPRGNGLVEGYLIAWGTPQDADLEGQYFTKATDLRLEYFDNYPVLYHHGMDNTVGLDPIGRIKAVNKDNIGLWVQAQLDMANTYGNEVYQMIQAQKFGWSSGSIDHLVKVAPDGHIVVWPLFEGSITPTPAQPHKTTVRALKSVLSPNDPVSRYLGGLLFADMAGDISGGLALKSDYRSSTMAKNSTKRYVISTLKKYGMRADPDVVEAVASDLEDPTAMADDEFDPAAMADDEFDPAAMSDFEDDAMMSDFEDDPAAALSDDEFDPAAMSDFGDEDSAMMAALDDPTAMADDEFDPAALSYMGTRKTQKNRNMQRRVKSVSDFESLALENLRLRKQVAKMSVQEAPGEKSVGMKSAGSVRVTKDEADQPGAYKSVFQAYVQHGWQGLDHRQQTWMRRGEVEYKGDSTKSYNLTGMKTLNTSNSGSVGFSVPEDFIPELNKNIMVNAETANYCKKRTTTSDTITQPDLVTTDARLAYPGTVSWPGENPSGASASAATEFTLGQIQIPIHVMLVNTTATYTALEDTSFDLAATINEWFTNLVAREFETLIFAGNGDGKLAGIVTDSRVTGSASAGIQTVSGYLASGNASTIDSADPIRSMLMHLPPQYRKNARWIMNSNTADIVSRLKDANGRYLWGDEQGLNQSIPTTLINRPIIYNEFASDVAANAFPLVLADLSQAYMIGQRVDFSIRRFDDATYAAQDMAFFIGRARLGGQVVLPPAIKVLKIAVS